MVVVLTSRKYGVATVWLVATLGAKSSTKKVTKKAILDVNVKKACETIIEPGAPLALRLQGNLLYGVSRVQYQQWDYLLSDVQAAQNNMSAMLKAAHSNVLDAGPSKTSRDQLLIMDDPAFAIDDVLRPPPDWLNMSLGIEPLKDSQRTSQSMLSIRSQRESSISSHASILGLDIPSSSRGGSYQLPVLDHFGGSSAQKGNKGQGIFNEEEELVFMDDDLFDFDADGELRDIPPSQRPPPRLGRLDSDSAASARVRKEHEDAFADQAFPIIHDEGDYNDMQYGEEMFPVLPDAEPFPVMSGGLGGIDKPLHLNEEDLVFSEEEPTSPDSAKAPQRPKKARTKKTLGTDARTMIPNNELVKLSTNYLEIMDANILINKTKKSTSQAKKNAFQYVYGSGLNKVGNGVGSLNFEHPLAVFSGETLQSFITGKPPKPKSKSKKGTKRPRASLSDNEDTPSKRPRDSEQARGGQGNVFDDEVLMNLNDDIPFPSQEQEAQQEFDNSIEMGRDAKTALTDLPSSAMMPWNVSASVGSHQRGQSSSIRGLMAGVGRGRVSASPLVGRGKGDNVPGALESFSQQFMHDDDDNGEMVLYGRSEEEDELTSLVSPSRGVPGSGRGSSRNGGGEVAVDDGEFERFGVAAGVDTQTAGQSQWVRDALDGESNNFLEYVKNSIEEKFPDELAGGGLGEDGEEDGEMERKVAFDELFEEGRNSAIVAAQAFYHVLCLATKGRVWVVQEGGEGKGVDWVGGEGGDEEEEMEPFGRIWVGVC